MSVFGYQSDQVNKSSSLGDHKVFKIRPEDTLDVIEFTPNRNICLVTNTNILMTGDIIFIRTAGIGRFDGERIFRLPARIALVGFFSAMSGTTFSNKGNLFFYRIDDDGHVFLTGEIVELNEEVIFNFTAYPIDSLMRFTPFNQNATTNQNGFI